MALFQNFPATANQQAQPGPPHADPMQPAAPQAAPRQLLAQGFSAPAQQQGGGGGGGGRSASFGQGATEGLPGQITGEASGAELAGAAGGGGAAAAGGEAGGGAGLARLAMMFVK